MQIGYIEALFRYPVKSMAGEQLEEAALGWHGIEGDRRLALRRVGDLSGFPWLTATKLPELLLFSPQQDSGAAAGDLPSHVRTANGQLLSIFGQELAEAIGGRLGSPVEMTHLRQGIFDDASISVIATDTIGEITRIAGQEPDVRRFRPNILVRLLQSGPFQEDAWIGGSLSFGEANTAPAVCVFARDMRCAMVNFNPDTAKPAPAILKTVVRLNQNLAGVYGTVTRAGQLAIGNRCTSQNRLCAFCGCLVRCYSAPRWPDA